MWQKISRSASCRVEHHHSVSNTTAVKAPHSTKHAARTALFPENLLPSGSLTITTAKDNEPPPLRSIYCVINKSVSAVVDRCSCQSSRSTTADEPIYAEEKKTSGQISSVEQTFKFDNVSEKIVARAPSEKLLRKKTLDTAGYHSIAISTEPCNPTALPQYGIIGLSASAPNAKNFWTSPQWLDLLDRASRTALDDATFKHLQISEARALVNKLENNTMQISSSCSKSLEDEDIQITSDTESEPRRTGKVPQNHKFLDQDSSHFAGKELDNNMCNCEMSILDVNSRMHSNDSEPVWRFTPSFYERVRLELETKSMSQETQRNERQQQEQDTNGLGLCPATRLSIVGWMSKVIASMDWPLSAFFTAVHAMDYTLRQEFGKTQSNRQSPEYGIPLLSTACVLVGVSAECEHKQLSRAKYFVGQVPTIANVKDIICKELSVVAGLKEGSLLHKTAPDFCLYYLARMKAFDAQISKAEGTFDSLYDMLCGSDFNLPDKATDSVSKASALQRSSLLSHLLLPRSANSAKKLDLPSSASVLGTMVEVALTVAQSLVENSLHTMIPLSRIVAAIMFHMTTLIAPGLKCAKTCTEFCSKVFLLDYDTEVKVLIPSLFLLYQNCIGTAEATARPMPSGNASHSSTVNNGLKKCSDPALSVMQILKLGQHRFPRLNGEG